jgi:pimeloyl-ACP methyl ester carboxylesterase
MLRFLREIGWGAALATIAAFAGCGGSSGGEAEGGGGREGPGGGAPAGRGTAGDGDSSRAVGPRPCPADFGALDECTQMPVPLDWTAPGGETISIFYGKKRAAGEARAQLWLLQGGPGGSGDVFSRGGYVDRLHDALPGVDVYVIEHRGVGESTRLGCAAQEGAGSDGGADVTEGEWQGCIDALRAEWGDRLRHFSSTAAALDLAAATDATRAEGRALFVYGVSYGTYWALQYLKARPGDASGVVLDSVATPGAQFFTDFGLQFDPVAERLAALCARDATCRAKLGDDPAGAARSIVARVDAGHCFGDDAAPGAVRALLARALQIRGANALVFPLLYRLDRCDEADREAIDHFFSLLVDEGGGSSAGAGPDSFAVRQNIGFSELWAAAPTEAEYDARCRSAAFCTPGDFDLADLWPRYAPPPDVHALPATRVPVLALNGDLDPQTPVEKAERVRAMLGAPGQTFVRVPFSTHFVLDNSPVRTPGAPPCGFQLVTGFVAAPEAPPDLSCLDDLEPPSFEPPPGLARRLFGTDDAWENEPGERRRGGDGAAAAPARRALPYRRPRREL